MGPGGGGLGRLPRECVFCVLRVPLGALRLGPVPGHMLQAAGTSASCHQRSNVCLVLGSSVFSLISRSKEVLQEARRSTQNDTDVEADRAREQVRVSSSPQPREGLLSPAPRAPGARPGARVETPSLSFAPACRVLARGI